MEVFFKISLLLPGCHIRHGLHVKPELQRYNEDLTAEKRRTGMSIRECLGQCLGDSQHNRHSSHHLLRGTEHVLYTKHGDTIIGQFFLSNKANSLSISLEFYLPVFLSLSKSQHHFHLEAPRQDITAPSLTGEHEDWCQVTFSWDVSDGSINSQSLSDSSAPPESPDGRVWPGQASH